MTPADGIVVRCSGVSHSYHVDGETVPALTELTLACARGAVTVLSGPSGSGKSTLLRMLACLDRPESGSVWLTGVETTTLSTRRRRALRREHVGYVHQDPADNLLDYLTVAEHLALGSRLRGRAAEGPGLAGTLGLSDRLDHRPRELSGGEQQRVALAFAAAGEPTLLVADEPTAQLDRDATQRVVDALRRLAGRGHAVVVANHDPHVNEAADHVIEIADGKRVEGA